MATTYKLLLAVKVGDKGSQRVVRFMANDRQAKQ
jgi:hypothetical protein